MSYEVDKCVFVRKIITKTSWLTSDLMHDGRTCHCESNILYNVIQ